MYKSLWKLINKIAAKESVPGFYLAANIMCWTVGTAILGVLGVLVLNIDMYDVLSDILCASAYAGIIFGLVGGILFLCNVDDKKADP